MGKGRLANFEVLRVLAMFMILVIHANMISLPRPSSHDLLAHTQSTVTRYVIESFGLVGVNLFVLISGWFLINTRAKSFLSLLYQIIVLWGGGYIFCLLAGLQDISASNFLEVLFFSRWDWFIKAYIVLMIIAPVLNEYVKNSSEPTQRLVLIGFFLFSSTYGWIGGASRFFINGYGPLHFIGLYLLAHYVRKCVSGEFEVGNKKTGFPFQMNKYVDLAVYFACVAVNSTAGVLGLYLGKEIYGLVFSYINPLNVLGALYLLLFFSKIEIKQSRMISFLATGSFSVYLLHSWIGLRPCFTQGVQSIYESFSGPLCLLMLFLYLVLVYLSSVLIDLPRLWSWKYVGQRYKIK